MPVSDLGAPEHHCEASAWCSSPQQHINPIPPLEAAKEEEEDLEMFMEDDGWEEEEQLVPVDNDDANAMSSVDSDHSET